MSSHDRLEKARLDNRGRVTPAPGSPHGDELLHVVDGEGDARYGRYPCTGAHHLLDRTPGGSELFAQQEHVVLCDRELNPSVLEFCLQQVALTFRGLRSLYDRSDILLFQCCAEALPDASAKVISLVTEPTDLLARVEGLDRDHDGVACEK